MSYVIYAIVFKGELLDGFQVISVKSHLAKILKADVDKMQILFSGKQVVLKRTADKTQAIKYANALKKIGADISVRVIKSEAPPPQKEQDSGLSLMPQEGYIVEPAPVVPSPILDLSGYSLVDFDEIFVIESSDQAYLELDLSEYSIKENDGSPLVEASKAEEIFIDVPDFGLDDAGAVLETIPDERELLNPDTTGMTLAAAGSILLEPEEKPPGPSPKVPDTSELSLVPNVD